jgi:hypothetical protein
MASLFKSRLLWVAVAVAVLLAAGLWFIPNIRPRLRNKALNFNAPDANLVDRVFLAADLQLPPAQVEQFVGTPAAINTLRSQADRDAIEHADIVADQEEEKDTLALLHPGLRDGSVSHVVYWIRPTEAHNPRLIGIVWLKNGKARVFFGVVLPPGG